MGRTVRKVIDWTVLMLDVPATALYSHRPMRQDASWRPATATQSFGNQCRKAFFVREVSAACSAHLPSANPPKGGQKKRKERSRPLMLQYCQATEWASLESLALDVTVTALAVELQTEVTRKLLPGAENAARELRL
ncbi:hypothetical protein BaRGS_00019906 [Batillaria attramentaria]|uniref:Uncharacterized protein n=1 Tax=Batillaria attramentaria TaxID=370345 RepID=A0ABD0KNH2_9CAEN